MDKQTAAWAKSIKAWIKTQQNVIASCDLNIKQAKEQIALYQKAIRLETKERTLKIASLKIVKENLSKTK